MDGLFMKLINKSTGLEIKVGDTVISERGNEAATVLSWTEPSHPGSSGKVTVREKASKMVREFFPQVFGLKFEE